MKVELLFITPNAEKLIEKAGRTAYLSFNKLGKNTEKKFILMMIKRGHESVLEHAYATFRIRGVSRSFTHQLVRHRLCSYTQQSQRRINESHFTYIEPKSIKENQEAHQFFKNFIDESKKVYTKLTKLGIKSEDARFVLPNAVESQIVVTANFRQWRHIIQLRGSPEAQWEIRNVIIEILKILKKYAPFTFQDLIIDSDNLVVNKISSS